MTALKFAVQDSKPEVIEALIETDRTLLNAVVEIKWDSGSVHSERLHDSHAAGAAIDAQFRAGGELPRDAGQPGDGGQAELAGHDRAVR
jgi:hypothetical protein